MVTEREADDSKRLLDRIAKEYEAEYRSGRLRLARRSKKRTSLINWRSLGAVLIWIALIVAVGILALLATNIDADEIARRMSAYVDSRS